MRSVPIIRIAHIITRMDRGGAPDIVRLLVEKLDPQRYEPTLIYGLTREPSAQTRRLLASLGQRAVCVPSLRRAPRPFLDGTAFFSLLKILRKGRFDLVHTHTAKAGVLGRIAARRAGVAAIVHSPHGHDFYGYFGRAGSLLVVWAERFAARFCDRIHVLTRLEEREMARYRICPAQKVRVIPSGVSVNVPAAAQRDKAGLCAGFVGRLEPVKGPGYFVEAAAVISRQRPQVRFLLAGEGSLRAGLEERSRALGLSPMMTFNGWVEDINALYGQIDILIVPSLNEAVGRVILEAGARGIPSVAAAVGGIPEVVRDGETGLLVKARDAKGMADAALRLLGDGAVRRRMGEAAAAWVRQEHDELKMVAGFEQLYNELRR